MYIKQDGANKKKRPTINKWIYRFLAIVSMLIVVIPAGANVHYKIGVIHSYEKGYHDAERYHQTLEKELSTVGIKAEINDLFLNCDELRYEDELVRASFFIDELTDWGADIIVIFNNQAAYSMLKCDNPRLRNIPVVFSGVYHPDRELIGQFPNVTGFSDIPDFVSTIRMIENMMGKSRIVVMSGSGMIDKQMWENLDTQCKEAGIETYEGDVFEHILAHRVVRNAYLEEKDELINEEIDTTVVMRLMSEAMPLRTIQQTARGSETYLMLTSRTYNSMDAQEFFVNPSFAVINEGFGSNTKMLGGYFCPLESQMKHLAEGIALRLQGKMPAQQITPLPKEYVLNWHALQRYGISATGLPEEYTVMYIPFFVRYRSLLISGFLLASFLIVAVIAFLIYSICHERGRKREALRALRYEHETLELAIEGGMTYAWRREKGGLSFDPHFYKLIHYTDKFITREQILQYIHPQDRERFCARFLQSNQYTNQREQYRCNFSGKYQWWQFRYNYVLSDGHAAVVTGLLQNIQEVKDRETELIEARNIAEQAELKQSFLNNMSHEIRTPLNAIVGFSSILAETLQTDDEEIKEYINIIHTNTDLLLNLINDILELSRIDSGAASFTRQDKNVRTLLESYYRTFHVQVKPGLEFLCDFPDENYTVSVDPMRLQQVVTNFLSNANKFTESGYIRLGYRYIAEEDKISIFVEDTGKGIPKNELEMIFSRFYKRDEFAQGAGLGLAICQGIVLRLHGQIKVESEVGKGSRFSVLLPAVAADGIQNDSVRQKPAS